MTPWSLRTSAGAPSAITLPELSTVILSETSITRRMTCSTSRMAMPRSSRMRRNRRSTSASRTRLNPTAGSSISSVLGSPTSARDLDQALLAERQFPTEAVGEACHADEVERPAASFDCLPLLLPHGPRSKARGEEAGPRAQVLAGDHDLKDRQSSSERGRLKRPAEAKCCNGARLHARHRAPVELNAAPIWP